MPWQPGTDRHHRARAAWKAGMQNIADQETRGKRGNKRASGQAKAEEVPGIGTVTADAAKTREAHRCHSWGSAQPLALWSTTTTAGGAGQNEEHGMKVEELTGAQLDYWVANAAGVCLHDAPHTKECGNWGTDYTCTRCGKDPHGNVSVHTWRPSSTWEQAGPIIDRENIQLSPPTSPVHRYGGPNAGNGQSGSWSACTWHRGADGRRAIAHDEKSPLVAAMRCFVRLKFGSTVPDEVPA